MAWSFGDGFDLYAAVADMINGYWDSSAPTNSNLGNTTPRFAGSQYLHLSGSSINYVKSSGINDAVHHFVVSFRQTAAISGTTLGGYLQLTDGATAQCSIVFRSDGAIVLTSGGPAGATLATYTGAFPIASTWYGFEFEVTINNTTGVFTVRKNGNNVADFTATGLDTQNSANAYANKLQLGMNSSVVGQDVDDLFWQSGASTGTWLGELRCATLMPASDQSVTFSKSPASNTQTVGSANTTTAITAGTARYVGFSAAYDGTIGTATVSLAVGYTGNLKCSIFASSGSAPTTVLGSATVVTNPTSGINTITFGTPVSVSKGGQYWIGFDPDTSSGTFNYNATISNSGFSTTAYASFPAASPTFSTAGQLLCTVTITITTNNCLVNEPQQDGLTSYVYDSNPGDQDFYGLSPLVPAGAVVLATTARAYMQKSDIGTRTAAVQLKSGATTVAAPTLTLTTSGWLWDWRTDLVDPNTSAAWTVAAVNTAQIGPKVIA